MVTLALIAIPGAAFLILAEFFRSVSFNDLERSIAKLEREMNDRSDQFYMRVPIFCRVKIDGEETYIEGAVVGYSRAECTNPPQWISDDQMTLRREIEALWA